MTDEAPVFVKRTKSKTLASRRATTSHNDEEVLSTPISNFKNRSKAKAKPQSRLSFDNNEEGEGTFQVKRSNLGNKLILKGPATSPIPALTSTLNDTSISSRSDGPRYDAAYLSELRASTAAAPRPERPVNTVEINDGEPAFDASEMEGAVIENLDDMQAVMSNSYTELSIPSESSIKAAKEKRDRLRKTETAEEDFIPLTVSKWDGPVGPHPESRLVREDDEMGEGDDDLADYTGARERVALSKKGRKEEEKKRKAGIVELIDEAEEQDEENMEWELAQVRRAGNAAKTQLQAAPKTYKPTPIPPTIPIPVLDAAIARLTQKLTVLTTSHAKNTAERTIMGEENASLKKQEAELKGQVENAEQRRAWFQGFKERMESVGDFLDEKFLGLEKLEEEHASLLRERFEMIQKRRADENEDDLVLVFGLSPDMTDVEQVDELGRTIPSHTGPQAPVRRERRAARSQRHATRAQLRGAMASDVEDAGNSTDASLPASDALDFEEAIQSLREKVKALFDDVKAKEFRDPKHGIAVWFGEWRTKYEDSWKNAWGGMGLVQAWEFWARVEMVGWIPLDTPPRLEAFAWYSNLHDFSRLKGEEEPAPEEDLPIQMTTTAFIPRLNALLNAGAFDPYSARHIMRMLDLAEQLETSLGTEDIKYQSVLQTVAYGFRKSITTMRDQVTRFTGVDVSRATGFHPESLSARMRFMIRAARLLSNLMRWRRYTKERHGLGLLCGEILSDVLLPVARGGWEVGAGDTLRKIVAAVPSDLVPMAVSLRLNSKP